MENIFSMENVFTTVACVVLVVIAIIVFSLD